MLLNINSNLNLHIWKELFSETVFIQIFMYLKDGHSFDLNTFHQFLVERCNLSHLKDRRRKPWKDLVSRIEVGQLDFRSENVNPLLSYNPITKNEIVRNFLVEVIGESKYQAVTNLIVKNSESDYDGDGLTVAAPQKRLIYEAHDEVESMNVHIQKKTKIKSEKKKITVNIYDEQGLQKYVEYLVDTAFYQALKVMTAGLMGRRTNQKWQFDQMSPKFKEIFCSEILNDAVELVELTLSEGIQESVDVPKEYMRIILEKTEKQISVMRDALKKYSLTKHPGQLRKSNDYTFVIPDKSCLPQLSILEEWQQGVSLRLMNHALKDIEDQETYDRAFQLWQMNGAKEHAEPKWGEKAFLPNLSIIRPVPSYVSALRCHAVELYLLRDKKLIASVTAEKNRLARRMEEIFNVNRPDDEYDRKRISESEKREIEKEREISIANLSKLKSEFEIFRVDYLSRTDLFSLLYIVEMLSDKQNSKRVFFTFFKEVLEGWIIDMDNDPVEIESGIYIHPSWMEEKYQSAFEELCHQGEIFPLRYLHHLWGEKNESNKTEFKHRFDPFFDMLDGKRVLVDINHTSVDVNGHLTFASIISLKEDHHFPVNYTEYEYVNRFLHRIVAVIFDAFGYEGEQYVRFYRNGSSYMVSFSQKDDETIQES